MPGTPRRHRRREAALADRIARAAHRSLRASARTAGRVARSGFSAGLLIATLAPAQAGITLAGDALHARGLLHLSYDRYHGGASASADGPGKARGIESNSSHLGFGGTLAGKAAVQVPWHFESEIDAADAVGAVTPIDRWLGVQGRWGRLAIGRRDTPLTMVADEYALFADTVADRTGILGQAASGANIFNARARNTLAWTWAGEALAVEILTARRFEGTAGPDRRHNRLDSVRISHEGREWDVALAREAQHAMDGKAGAAAIAWRAAARLRRSRFSLGGVYENLRDHGWGSQIARAAFAVHGAYTLDPAWELAAQWMHANRSAAGQDGADLATVGISYRVGPNLSFYTLYARLANEAGAAYRFAPSDHGQVYRPATPGRTVHAWSVGLLAEF